MGIKYISNLVFWRRVSQVLFLGFFLYLFFTTDFPVSRNLLLTTENIVTTPVSFFFHLDTLLALSALLAGKVLSIAALLAIPVLVLALMFNRAFCGWVCPFGTIHQLASSGRSVAARTLRTGRWRFNRFRNIKFILLLAVLAAAPLGANLAGWLDPFSFLNRGLAIIVHPVLGRLMDALANLLDRCGLPGLADSLLALLRGRLVPFDTRFFVHAFAIGVLFILAVWLNRLETRFWCRWVCPLGALLGLLARKTPLVLVKDEAKCTRCLRCLRHCQGGDQPLPGEPWIPSECHFCANCTAACPEDALHFRLSWRQAKTVGQSRQPLPDLGRRAILGGVIGGVLAAPLLAIGAERLEKGRGVFKISNRLIRPPGAKAEEEFLSLCIKCGACMKVCPTNALHPAAWEAGIGGIWTPVLVPKIGYCDDRCTLCGQVCPTGAIRVVTTDEKLGRGGQEPIRLGLAYVDRNRCLPWAQGKACIVCEEVCPTVQGEKAIKLEPDRVHSADGAINEIKKPIIDQRFCIGCGICENKCPVADSSAIIVTCVGESRSVYNRISAPGSK